MNDLDSIVRCHPSLRRTFLVIFSDGFESYVFDRQTKSLAQYAPTRCWLDERNYQATRRATYWNDAT